MALARDATHVEAFDALFSTYHDDVYGLAQALLRNEQDAEDVTQDVFIRAYRALPFYQPERATLRTWLSHMTVNACKTHRRRNFLRNFIRGNRGGNQGILDEERARNSPDLSAWGAPEEHVLQVELRQSIEEVLGNLRLEHRTVVVLHYYRNFSCQEIARMVGCPEGTVRSRLHYARRLVKVYLEQRTLSPTWEDQL